MNAPHDILPLASNAAYLERLYERYAKNPDSIDGEWRRYFEQLSKHERGAAEQNGHPAAARTKRPAAGRLIDAARDFQRRVDAMILAFRLDGHRAALLDPLGLPRANRPEFTLEDFGFSPEEYELAALAPEPETVAQLHARLHQTYCRYLAVQYLHIDDRPAREFLERQIEERGGVAHLEPQAERRILQRIIEAEVFEDFIRKKYLGANTFSLKGSEMLIALLDLAIDRAAEQGVKEIVLAMAHRGRLNVLVNTIGQPPRDIFRQFEDAEPERHRGGGDVKYHLGASSDRVASSGKEIHLSLCFNPSHVEFVNPVALGRMRAKQDRAGDAERARGMVLLMHGDAAFAGGGIVAETLNLSQLAGYAVGGALHVIINNQLGFTTVADEARSTTYAANIARMLQVPLFHVNGEQPAAVALALELAMNFRARFRRDVVLDFYCYRHWGHNETDDPSFTQPLMYKAIEHHEPLRVRYERELIEREVVAREAAERFVSNCKEHLHDEYELAQREKETPPATIKGVWKDYLGGLEPAEETETAIDGETLQSLLQALTSLPDDFHPHRNLKRSIEHRREMAAGNRNLDWSTAEALAFASLAVEGHRVRLTGQDTVRGTFSQRHAVLHDAIDGRPHEIFSRLAPGQAPVEIINSPLCEAGALGFDYGFSLDYPEALVAWEAQFGDFVNAAQVIIDQFIASAEDKWQRLSGMVLLLPHAFEGQGPEHSSAQIERFLTLCSEDNIQVANLTTPAQYFHCLRRQVKRKWRKPLIIFTPKSLLRHSRAQSPLDDFTSGGFQRLIPDLTIDPANVERILLCSGKVYYDLLKHREEQGRDRVAIVRVEQFYPLGRKHLEAALADYPEETPIRWVQEEPQNMGAWLYWKLRFGDRLLDRFPLSVTALPFSSSPATGSKAAHKLEQAELVERAFA